jgi:hypothetical protein
MPAARRCPKLPIVTAEWLLDGCCGPNRKDGQRMKSKPGLKDAYAWDDRVHGFGVKVTPRGARIYVIKYRSGGAQRWMLGRHGEITAEQARAKAVRLRGAIANGEDPAGVRDERAAEPTVDQFADRYLEE